MIMTLSIPFAGPHAGHLDDAMGNGAEAAIGKANTAHGQPYADNSHPATSGMANNAFDATGASSAEMRPATKQLGSKIRQEGTQRRRPQSKALKSKKSAEDAPEERRSVTTKVDARKRTKKAPKKSAQRPATQEPNSDFASPGMDDIDEDMPLANHQRDRVLERNRLAATKCRIRKRSEASTLATWEQEMEDQNRQLSACFEALRHEIYTLKTQLLRHTDCDCVLIQRYIANEAKKSVDKLTGVDTSAPMGFGPQGSGDGAPGGTPDWQDSSRASTAADSMPVQSPMTSMPGDGMHTPWTEPYSAESGLMPQHILDGHGYQHGPAMMPYNQMPLGSPMDEYGPQTPITPMGMPSVQYMQQGFTNDMMWSTGWQTG